MIAPGERCSGLITYSALRAAQPIWLMASAASSLASLIGFPVSSEINSAISST